MSAPIALNSVKTGSYTCIGCDFFDANNPKEQCLDMDDSLSSFFGSPNCVECGTNAKTIFILTPAPRDREASNEAAGSN